MFKIIMIVVFMTITVFAYSSVLKTGQTKSYDVDGNIVVDGSIKDDGYYQAGKVRSYSRNGDVVIDNSTKLEWQDDVDSVQKEWEENGLYPAAEYCNTLPLGRYTDWRLPSIQELWTLIDNSQSFPSVSEGIFSHIFSNFYWSSTTYTGNNAYAWFIRFNIGHSDITSKIGGYGGYYVRCVRGGLLEPSSFSRNDENNIVTDITTGLQWQDNDVSITVDANWKAAIDYCENILSLGGYSDWRLPNKNELLSIVDYSQYDPSMNSIFTYRGSSSYWSSTTEEYDTGNAWIVNFQSAYSNIYGKHGDLYVRCVRDGQVGTSTFLSPVIMYLLN